MMHTDEGTRALAPPAGAAFSDAFSVTEDGYAAGVAGTGEARQAAMWAPDGDRADSARGSARPPSGGGVDGRRVRGVAAGLRGPGPGHRTGAPEELVIALVARSTALGLLALRRG